MSEPEIKLDNAEQAVEAIRTIRQARLYTSDPVDPDTLDTLIEVARWTGSARNTQPWHLIVIDDRGTLKELSQLRPPINWLADAPVAIAIALDGESPLSEAYDEGRLSERVLAAARLLGLGGGVAWFGDAEKETRAKSLLGIPDNKTARGVLAIGKPTTTKDHRPNANIPGRKPRAELVSVNRYGSPEGSE